MRPADYVVTAALGYLRKPGSARTTRATLLLRNELGTKPKGDVDCCFTSATSSAPMERRYPDSTNGATTSRALCVIGNRAFRRRRPG